MPPTPTGRPAVLRFWALAFTIGLAVLAIERAVLAAAFGGGAPGGDVAASFLHGLRFDAAGLAYPMLLALFAWTAVAAIRPSAGPTAAVGAAACAVGLVALVAVVEVPFFAEFRVRLDFVALEYLDDAGEALSLGAASVGGAGLLAMAVCLAAAAAGAVAALRRAATTVTAARPCPACVVGLAGALFVAARGGFGRPLRPQDADRSAHAVVNQLDLSGPFTLARHAYEWFRDRDGAVRDYGITPAEADHLAESHPPAGPSVSPSHPRVFEIARDDDRRHVGANVVVILLESFAAKHVGACGARGAAAWTPQFDRVARAGFLYHNFWAAGPSTNRAVPAIFASFPSLPSRLALTKSVAGQQDFRALPRILGEIGYDSCFVSGGAEEWENLGGWLRQQGFGAVVGRADFDEPWRSDRWGPPDAALLDRVLAECDARHAKGAKFLVSALTTTNHPPFPVPDDDLGRSISGATDRERAMRYADAAFGRFMDAALARPWAKDTLFVLLGDHGFHEDPQAEIDPDRYRVPLLVIQPPGRRPMNDVETYPSTACDGWGMPSSHLDVVPIVLRFVAPKGTRFASWGAWPRLFRPDEDRVVVLGPHGGEPVVAALDASGNYLVERLDGGRSRLYRLVGGDVALRLVPEDGQEAASAARRAERMKEPAFPDGRLVPHDDPAAEARLRRYVRGFLTSAQRVLASRNAGGAAAPR